MSLSQQPRGVAEAAHGHFPSTSSRWGPSVLSPGAPRAGGVPEEHGRPGVCSEPLHRPENFPSSTLLELFHSVNVLQNEIKKEGSWQRKGCGGSGVPTMGEGRGVGLPTGPEGPAAADTRSRTLGAARAMGLQARPWAPPVLTLCGARGDAGPRSARGRAGRAAVGPRRAPPPARCSGDRCNLLPGTVLTRVLDFAEWTSMMKTGKVPANFQGEFAARSLHLKVPTATRPLTGRHSGVSASGRRQRVPPPRRPPCGAG